MSAKNSTAPVKTRRLRTTILALCEGALMVALATGLDFLKLWEMPQGGSITLAMLPLCFYAVRWGVPEGLIASFVYGLIQLMHNGGFAIGWQSVLGDYLVAFTAVGLAGLGRGKSGGIFWGSLVGCLARYAVHYVVGATVWAEYMPEIYCGLKMSSPWFYSLIYNGIYMIPCTVLALVVLCLLNKPMRRYLNGADMSPTFGFTFGGLTAVVVGLIGIWYGVVTNNDAEVSGATGTVFLVLGVIFAVGGLALLVMGLMRRRKQATAA